jgi:hypothetical protein
VQFRKHWAGYQTLVDNDYLSHRAVGGLLHDTLAADLDAPFAFLDIACGDASLTKAALADTRVRHYHGIDLAEPAIKLAAANLAGVPYAVDLDHRDFVEALNDRPEPADASWIGLSLHHLPTAEKIRLMQAIRRATQRVLMIYEPARRDDEDLKTFIARFLAISKVRWKALTDAEWNDIENHIATYDLPETVSGWLDVGRQAGFTEARELFADPTGTLRVFRYDP